MTTDLHIGGMVAGGFDATGKYLLVISHAGSGVFACDTWARVARDSTLAYPQGGTALGIGPIKGEKIDVHEIDHSTGVLAFASPDGRWFLRYAEGTLVVSSPQDCTSLSKLSDPSPETTPSDGILPTVYTSSPPPTSIWRRKKTYLWALALLGFIDAFLYDYGVVHPPTQGGLQLFIGFTLNVALLGWCYVDADEKRVPISGWLSFVMLFVSLIGVPWYFLRSRGLIGAFKGGFGFGLYAIYVSTMILGALVAGLVGLLV